MQPVDAVGAQAAATLVGYDVPRIFRAFCETLVPTNGQGIRDGIETYSVLSPSTMISPTVVGHSTKKGKKKRASAFTAGRPIAKRTLISSCTSACLGAWVRFFRGCSRSFLFFSFFFLLPSSVSFFCPPLSSWLTAGGYEATFLPFLLFLLLVFLCSCHPPFFSGCHA